MIASEVSGVAFSVHPVTQDKNQILIEAGRGLGEAVVSGSITPDSYIVGKKDFKVGDARISLQTRKLIAKRGGGSEWVNVSALEQNARKLADEKVVEIARLAARIEEHFGYPIDVEWAFENDRLYILQARPITTLSI